MKSLLRLCSLWLLALALATPASSQTALPVRFAHGTEYFPENFKTAPLAAPVPDSAVTAGFYARYLQFFQVLTSEQRSTLEASGVRVLGYVHFGAYLVLLPQQFDFSSLEALPIRSVVPVATTWKMHRNLQERPLGAWAVHDNEVDVNAQIYPHLSIADGAALCQKAGLTVLREGTQNGFVQLRVRADRLETVAGLPFVQWLELVPPPGQPEDLNGRSLHRSNLLDSDAASGLHFNGEGVSVLVRDDGAVGPHIDFKGRLYNAAGLDTDASNTHGDGVAGIIGGAGNLDPTKKGMAAGADVYVQDYVNDFQDETLPLHLEEGVTITNSSYSDGCNVGYTLATQTVDQQLFEHPTLMHVFSAGNSNGNDCGYGAGTQWGNITGGHKMAKNSIATANLTAAAVIDPSSSRGPAYDGRLKPDVAAHGTDQNSTDPDNGYQVFGGTSAAAPGIAGCLAQLTHAYRDLTGDADVPSALLKIAVLNTANDLGPAGPDFTFGWGHVNTARAFKTLEDLRYFNSEIAQGDVTHLTVTIPAGLQQARLMLYWAEDAAQPSAARALLNDLDLTVTAPDGSVLLPWKPDPTPSTSTLGLAAGKGRDSLNNVEQVAIDNPVAGEYTITVKGYEVPFGPQAYWLAWEWVADEVRLTYPNGGEGLVPGTQEWVRWDASTSNLPFTLQYSVNDGATWQNLATPGANQRMFNWTIPNTVSGKVRLQITRGTQTDISDAAFSIAPLPTNVEFKRVCPDSATISWTPVNDTLAYDVYLLGQKYQELKGQTAASELTVPIANATQAQWAAVRAATANGLTGRRTLAVQWPGGLKACPQPFDAILSQVLAPNVSTVITCGDADPYEISIRVTNGGQNPWSDATAYYRLGNGAVVSEPLPALDVNESVDFTFQTPANLTNGVATLATWVTLSGDDFVANDTVVQTLTVITSSADTYFTQNFDNQATPLPTGWAVANPDNKGTWEYRTQTVTGVAGAPTRAYWVDHYAYSPGEGQEDYLYAIPFDLTNVATPALRFNYSHASYPGYVDALRVEALANCDLTATPVVLWELSDPDLAVTSSQSKFFPGASSDWRTVNLPLEQFVGEKVVIRFVSVNGFGNSTFVDNVALTSFEPGALPTAAFTPPNDTLCRAVSTPFEATPSAGVDNVYLWSFGASAIPATATGIGPHNVVFATAGDRNIRLIVNNPAGSDTLIQPVKVLPNPTANFTQVADNLTVTFTNTTINAESYLWDFGDGFTSTEANPVHTYAAASTYTVTLNATNFCKTVPKTATLTLTSGSVEQVPGLRQLRVSPNPTTGDFVLEISNDLAPLTARLSLLDAAGRVVYVRDATAVPTGTMTVPFTGLQLAAGHYQLRVETPRGTAAVAVVKLD